MNKINIITGAVVAAAAFLTVGCTEEDNPSIDDYPWNYEITEVKATENIPVGMLLYNPSNVWTNQTAKACISDPYEPENGKIGPYVRISAGEYEFYGAEKEYEQEYADALANILANYRKAKVDFIIPPNIGANPGSLYPNNIGRNDTVMLNMILGKADTLLTNDGSVKMAMRIDINNFTSQFNATNNNSLLENANPKTVYDKDGQPIEIKPMDAFYNWFRRLSWYFNEPNYFHFNGRPVLILEQANKLYTANPREVYDNIREAIKHEVGKDVYLIVRQEQWTPPARWEYFWIQGQVDAVYPRNLTNLGAGNGWDRSVWYNVFINEHMKVNREYYAKRGINYVPSVSPSFYQYVWSQTYGHPIIRHDVDDFRVRCWSAKMQLGTEKMVIIDAYNDWMFANALEPTDEDYGFGWGDKFLLAIADEFKVK